MTEAAEDPLRRRQYENPPVTEAIARLRWAEPLAWTMTTAGVLLEHLKDSYPEEPRAQAVLQAGVFGDLGDQAADGAPAPRSFGVRSGPQRILYSAEDGSRLLGVAPEDLSVHGLRPYEGWESIEERLIEGCGRVPKALGLAEPSFSQVGLRYINSVDIPSTTFRFSDYLTIDRQFPDGFPEATTGFLDRSEMKFLENDVFFAFTWASTEGPPDCSSFILDIDLVASLDDPVDLGTAMEMLRDLKRREGRAFEALLKDSLRELFGVID